MNNTAPTLLPHVSGAAPGSLSSSSPLSPTRTVCDHCRKRRIRCDGQFPCQQCKNVVLECTRDHVPRKRGPKRGHGRVINELRATQAQLRAPVALPRLRSGPEQLPLSELRPNKQALNKQGGIGPTTSLSTSSPHAPWASRLDSSIPARDKSSRYLQLIPCCVDLYEEHIYPTMPLVYMPFIRSLVQRPLAPAERNLVCALAALTCLHMSGKNILVSDEPPPKSSWELAGRFFLDECLAARRSYDFIEELALNSVVSSLWLSTSFLEINESRKSWVYLREALTLALELGLDNEATYSALDPREKLCRQRVCWQLFVTERFFAVLRKKPVTLRKMPSVPSIGHAYESPEIHEDFLQLIDAYRPLDEAFVSAWNDGSDPSVQGQTFLELQHKLVTPPPFPSRSTPGARPTVMHPAGPCLSICPPNTPAAGNGGAQAIVPGGCLAMQSPPPSEPTAIQKPDLLSTRQWLVPEKSPLYIVDAVEFASRASVDSRVVGWYAAALAAPEIDRDPGLVGGGGVGEGNPICNI